MSREFENYKSIATSFLWHHNPDKQVTWQRFYDWYRPDGREQFRTAFTKETGLRLGEPPSTDDIVAAAIPKSYGDLKRKIRDDAFYRAHSFWFVDEMDEIVNAVPRQTTDATDAQQLGDVLQFTSKVLLDSILLFEHWGTYRAGVPVSTVSAKIHPNKC